MKEDAVRVVAFGAAAFSVGMWRDKRDKTYGADLSAVSHPS